MVGVVNLSDDLVRPSKKLWFHVSSMLAFSKFAVTGKANFKIKREEYPGSGILITAKLEAANLLKATTVDGSPHVTVDAYLS
eukprot:scaffold35243_cov37-Cyclotella_meneghiniana.AAC.3